MGKQTNKAVVAAQSSGIVVGSGTRKLHAGPRLRMMLIGLAAAVLLAAVAGGVWALYQHNQQVHAQRVAAQKKLQKTLADVNAVGNPQQLKQDSTDLINGANSGKYDVSNADLSQAYSDRGYVEVNNKNYQAALDDFRKAEQLDPASKDLALYGELLARYHLGERKTLIPLLQELVKAQGGKDANPDAAQKSAEYNSYISSLQAGEDLPL